MRRIAPLIALPTTIVFAACFNPRAGDMAEGGNTDADETSAGTTNGTATAPTTNDTTPTTADDDPTAATSGPGETESDDGGCTEHDDCTDPRAPFCTAGTCVACDETPTPNDACASRYPDSPLCDAGECVQCTAADTSTCDGTTPVCDTDARTCTACTYHDQCPDSACHIAEGSCMPTDRVWTVDYNGGGDYTNLSDALSQIGGGQIGTIVVHDGLYLEDVTINNNRVVAIVSGSGSPGIVRAILSDSTVYLQGLRLTSNDWPTAISASGARLWLDECKIQDIPVGTSGLTAFSQNTAVRLRANSELTMRNSFAGGFYQPGQPGIDVAEGSDANIVYSTVGARSTNVALTCSNPGSVVVRNSILAAQGTPVHTCVAAELVSTALRASVNEGWFVNYTAGDFHLTASGATQFQNIAAWQVGDPPFDIDGDARPQVEAAFDFGGADVP